MLIDCSIRSGFYLLGRLDSVPGVQRLLTFRTLTCREILTPMFDCESNLVAALEQRLNGEEGPFAQLMIAFEFDYHEGRVDVVARNGRGELFGFEAKLSYWQKAVHQAYRNTSFTHYSYVVLPEAAARKAVRARHEFERRGIGLCSISQDGIFIHIPAARKKPLRPWLTDSALEYIDEEILESAVLGGSCCRLPSPAPISPLPMNFQPTPA